LKHYLKHWLFLKTASYKRLAINFANLAEKDDV